MTQEAILYYADNPADFVEDLLHVTPDKNQRAILDSVAKNQMTSVRSGHGIGKSAVEAWTVIWFMSTRPFPKIPCTAPTQHQLFDILWAEISKWLRNNKALERELMWTKEKVYMKQYPEEWFAVARTASKPDALQGFHADDILYIIDEASGVDDKVFEPVLGALSTPGARLLMCGNPTQLSGFFYDSHHKNRGSYTTFHVDGRNSSRVSDDFVKTIIQMYGEDSDVFRVRVAGEFPRQENDVFIPLPLVEKSIMTEWTEPTKPARIDIGCDVARYGDDRTVIGYKVDEKAMFYKRKSGQDLMQTADDIMELGLKLMEKYRFDKAIPIKIDDSGLGGGVTDRLRRVKREQPERFWWMDIIPVYFGQRIHHDFYYDSTTYMMSVVKNLLAPQTPEGAQKPVQLILPNDNDLVGQLSTRKYSMTDDAKIRVESKDAMKKRGMHSPDEADCMRDYSIACLPAHGVLQLLLRLHRHPDGQLGRMSGWLAEQLPIGGIVPLRVRAQHRFRQGDHTRRAMILIGNGVGVAGLGAAAGVWANRTGAASARPMAAPRVRRVNSCFMRGSSGQRQGRRASGSGGRPGEHSIRTPRRP